MANDSCVLIGKIYTLDDSRPEVGGVAIREGKIVQWRCRELQLTWKLWFVRPLQFHRMSCVPPR